jgi:hypothetical protein
MTLQTILIFGLTLMFFLPITGMAPRISTGVAIFIGVMQKPIKRPGRMTLQAVFKTGNAGMLFLPITGMASCAGTGIAIHIRIMVKRPISCNCMTIITRTCVPPRCVTSWALGKMTG